MKKFIVTPFGKPEEILTEEQQAHIDAANDAASEDNTICLCGKLIDECDEAYVHITSGC